MKHYSLPFLLCLLCWSCNSNQHDLHIPDHVKVTGVATDVQIPGSKIFVHRLPDYILMPQLTRLEKNDSAFLQVFEIPSSNFEERKNEMVKGMEDAQKSGKLDKEYYKKDFKLGNYNALLYYGPDNKPHKEQIVLAFGDKTFTVLATAEVSENDITSRDELVKMLLSLYENKNAATDISALVNYTLDVKGTEFKYTSNMSQAFFYTIGGKGDPINNPLEDVVTVMIIPAMNEDALKDFTQNTLKHSTTSGVELINVYDKDTLLNGNYAYQVVSESSYNGRPCSVYQLATSTANGGVLIMGCAYNRRAELMRQIRQIAGTVRVK